MRILTVSDKVVAELDANFDRRLFGAIDLVLSCGDLPPEYLIRLASRFEAPLYYVCGNHDIRLVEANLPGCTNLNARFKAFRGLTILGLEGSRWYNGGGFQYTEREMRWKVLALTPGIWRRRGVDIVITHAPPRHIHDAEDRCHRGFKSFRRLIDRHRPRFFIHGHIHAEFSDPSERITVLDHTRVINTYGYYVLEIETEKVAGPA
jgi:Icc-related predicted phosphoesterase